MSKLIQTMDDVEVGGKVVFLRLDLNVPTDNDGQVTDMTRVARTRNTVGELSQKGARVVILSHFGRPKGKRDPRFSLSFLPPILRQQWGLDIAFADDCIGEAAVQAIKGLADGEVLLLENLRFYAGEEDCTPEFTSQIGGGLGEIYINDAFSASHRVHASIEGLAHIMPSYVGRAMERELDALESALGNPERPVVAIVGGAKISTKLDILNNLVSKVDVLVLGGGMANTFLHAVGCDLGQSLCEKDMMEQVQKIFAKAEEEGCDILLPVDGKAAEEFKPQAIYDEVSMTAVPNDRMILDIGANSIMSIKAVLDQCATCVWNGPLGAFEIEPFDEGTNKIALHAATLAKKGDLKVIAGGGDTVAALAKANVIDDITYVSTAGGAFLEWLEGKTLPGVAALEMHDKAA